MSLLVTLRIPSDERPRTLHHFEVDDLPGSQRVTVHGEYWDVALQRALGHLRASVSDVVPTRDGGQGWLCSAPHGLDVREIVEVLNLNGFVVIPVVQERRPGMVLS